MEIIKTKHKTIISKDFSYPIGAEALSEALAGAKQYDQFELYFSDRAEFRASAFNKRIKEKGNLLVLRFEYNNRKPGFSASKAMDNLYGEHWTIYVYAVPRNMKNEIKTELLKLLLLQGKPWLERQIAEQRSDYARVDFFINLKTAKFGMDEFTGR